MTGSAERDLDVVLLGASGFVGRLAAAYLAEHAPAGLRIGLAGRSEQRVSGVRAGLGARAASWPIAVADLADSASLDVLSSAARVVVTTAGPYLPYGVALVEACARNGTHYADVTGEVLFMRESIDRCHDAAARSGARIVHACGVDSIPSDLGVLLLHRAAVADGAGDLEDTTMLVRVFRDGFSGGTFATMKLTLDEVRARPESRRIAGDPYALSPSRGGEPRLGDEHDLTGVVRDRDRHTWVGPFVMARTNTRVVRRSNALQDWAYGRRFRYREVMAFGDGLAAAARAYAVTGALRALEAGLQHGTSRSVLDRILPDPGEGPGEKARSAGRFRMEFDARTAGGALYEAVVAGRGDPGYAATAVMLGESALCLALDGDRLPDRAGVLTPSTAMGDALVDRLRRAGLTLTARRSAAQDLTPPG